MAEVLSSNQGPQKQESVLRQNVTKPNYILGKTKRQLALVDEEDNDDEDDEVFEDVSEPREQGDCPENNENAGDLKRYQDDEYDDMTPMTFENYENEVQGDGWEDSEDYSENEHDVVAREQLQDLGLERETVSKLKARGSTMIHAVHMREFEAREVIRCNEFGQHIGPVTEEKDIVGQFSQFFGTIARNYSYAPLIHTSWHKVPHKDRMWEYVLKRCSRAKELRLSQKNMHTAGPKSFARIREEMKNDEPNKELPTLTQLFERTRRRTEGHTYVDSYDDTAGKIEQMKNYKPLEDKGDPVDAFVAVMNEERPGYHRLYGRGVTNRLIKKVNGGETSYMISRELMESFKAKVEVEKIHLIDMRKEIVDEHERRKKKAELEAMKKDLEDQRESMESKMRMLIEYLPREV